MRFAVKAHSTADGVVVIDVDALSPEEAMQLVRARGYVAFAAEERASGGLPLWRRERRFSLLQFSQQLLSLLEAGLNLVEAIEALAEKESNLEVQGVLQRLLDRMYAGVACSIAMEEQGATFPPFYVATIRASERTGNVPESLRRYVAYQLQIESVRKKVTSAMIYPAILVIAGGLVMLFLLGYVVPKFSRIYDERATDLPWLSQLLILWGKAVAGHVTTFVGAAVGLAAAAGWAVIHPVTRRWFARRVWTAPVVGERLRLYQLARFFRTVGMLLRGGTPIVAALALVPGLLSASLREQLEQAKTLVGEGKAISEALQLTGLTTPVATRMLRVGEQSGNMGEMMERVAVFLDDEIAQWIDVFTKVFEPALMTLIGVMIGGIVVLMYLPIFEIAGSLQ